MRMEVVGDARIDVRLAGQLAEDARYDDERGTVRGVVACDINMLQACELPKAPVTCTHQKPVYKCM